MTNITQSIKSETKVDKNGYTISEVIDKMNSKDKDILAYIKKKLSIVDKMLQIKGLPDVTKEYLKAQWNAYNNVKKFILKQEC